MLVHFRWEAQACNQLCSGPSAVRPCRDLSRERLLKRDFWFRDSTVSRVESPASEPGRAVSHLLQLYIQSCLWVRARPVCSKVARRVRGSCCLFCTPPWQPASPSFLHFLHRESSAQGHQPLAGQLPGCSSGSQCPGAHPRPTEPKPHCSQLPGCTLKFRKPYIGREESWEGSRFPSLL